MFNKLKALYEYPQLSARRQNQLILEDKIDTSMSICSNETQIAFLQSFRQLNRKLSSEGYKLELTDLPEHAIKVLDINEKIYSTVLSSKCICEGLHAATALIKNTMNS